MSILEVQIDTSEPEATLARLQRQVSASGLGVFLNTEAWPWLEQRTQDRFTSEGDSAVGKWAELSFATYAYRTAGGFPPAHPINVRTGELRDFALTHQVESQMSGITLSQPKKGGKNETQKKFRNAQRGGTTAQGHAFPARPVVGLDMLDAGRIEQRLFKWVTTGGDNP